MDIRNSLKAFSQSGSHLVLPDIAVAARRFPARHVEDAVFCKIAHNGIQVMPVKRFEEALQ